MPAAHKKVIVRRFVGDVLPGYLPVSGFVRQGSLGLLDLDGRVFEIPLNDVKCISYVRDFNLGDTNNPERITRRSFLARPRSEGLWIRLTFRNSSASAQDPRSADQLEGLAAADTTFLDDLLVDAGIHLTPPDTRSNTQRIFVPRSAITDLQIVAVVTTPSRRKPVPLAANPLQDELFATPLPTPPRPS